MSETRMDNPPPECTSHMSEEDPNMGEDIIGAVLKDSRKSRKHTTCYPCQRRKVKCDRGRPCKVCVARDHSFLCLYGRPTDRSRGTADTSNRATSPAARGDVASQDFNGKVSILREQLRNFHRELRRLRAHHKNCEALQDEVEQLRVRCGEYEAMHAAHRRVRSGSIPTSDESLPSDGVEHDLLRATTRSPTIHSQSGSESSTCAWNIGCSQPRNADRENGIAVSGPDLLESHIPPIRKPKCFPSPASTGLPGNKYSIYPSRSDSEVYCPSVVLAKTPWVPFIEMKGCTRDTEVSEVPQQRRIIDDTDSRHRSSRGDDILLGSTEAMAYACYQPNTWYTTSTNDGQSQQMPLLSSKSSSIKEVPSFQSANLGESSRLHATGQIWNAKLTSRSSELGELPPQVLQISVPSDMGQAFANPAFPTMWPSSAAHPPMISSNDAHSLEQDYIEYHSNLLNTIRRPSQQENC